KTIKSFQILDFLPVQHLGNPQNKIKTFLTKKKKKTCRKGNSIISIFVLRFTLSLKINTD
ncbi:hypothetical protein NL466_27305, partial [Klebsiella pneumoniae]|nr:hypothetical protein [Klebsiella pneumoniae]